MVQTLKSNYRKIPVENFFSDNAEGAYVDFHFKVGFQENANMPKSFMDFQDEFKFTNNDGSTLNIPAITNAIIQTGVNDLMFSDAANNYGAALCYNHIAFLIDSFEVRFNNERVDYIDSNFGLIDTFVKRKNAVEKNETLGSVENLYADYRTRNTVATNGYEKSWEYRPSIGIFNQVIRENTDVHIRIKLSSDFMSIIQSLPMYVPDGPEVEEGPDVPLNVSQYDETTLASYYSYVLKDINLYVLIEQVDRTAPTGNLTSPDIVYDLDCHQVEIRKLTDNNTPSQTMHTISPSVYEIGYALQYSDTSSSHPFFSPSRFVSGPEFWKSSTQSFFNYADYINKSYMVFQNQTYPSLPYESDADDKGAYGFFMAQLDQGFDYNAVANESYSYFKDMGRYWMYKINKKPQDKDTKLMVYMDFIKNIPTEAQNANPPQNTNLLVYHAYKKVVGVYYDHNGEINKCVQLE